MGRKGPTKPVKSGEDVQLSVRVDAETAKGLDRYAAELGEQTGLTLGRSDAVRALLRLALKGHQGKGKR